MEKYSEVNKGIIEKSINSFDWDDINKMYKILGIKVGSQTIKIDGLNKKGKTTPETIKKEIELVLNYIIDNDIPEFSYGPWTILWVNGEWEIEIAADRPGDESLIVPIMESKLQIHFIPQSTTIKELLDIDLDEDYYDEEENKEIDEVLVFEARLKKAIDNEDWMIASKLRDLIEELKK